MDTETYLRVAAIVIAAVLLFSNFNLNFSALTEKVKSIFKRKPKVTPIPEKENVSFLEIVETWHKLRHQCEVYGLKDAVEKIDEVFPLLNTED